jgi:adenylate cyclase
VRSWLGALLVTVLVYLTQFLQVFSFWDEQVLDHASQLTRPNPLDLPLCVVELSDETIQELGNPPSRAVYAHMLDVLAKGGARWVVLDLVFDLPRRDSSEDSALAQALRRHPNTTLSGQLPESQIRSGTAGVLNVLASQERVRPMDAFLVANPRWGVVLNREDADGVVRRYRSAWKDLDGRSRLSLGARALVDMGWFDSTLLEQDPWNDPRGFRIRFAGGARSFPYYSLEKVVDDSNWTSPTEDAWGERLDLSDSIVKSGAFRDKIVLVGATARTLQDIYKIPGDENSSMSGVELHAHAMATFLSRKVVNDPPRLFYWPLVFLVAWALLRYLRRLMHGWLAVAVLLALLLGWVILVVAVAAWMQVGLLLSVGVVVLSGTVLVAAVERMMLEVARKREITRAFGQYVSPEVVRMMINDPSRVVLGGTRAEITALFSDFEGFTSLTEGLPAEDLVRHLGDAFSTLSQVLLDEGGTLDKFMGDAIMAEFGMPFPQADKAVRACRAAWKMQQALEGLRGQARGFPDLHMRVGVSTGEAIFGNLGSRQKFDYTALGDAVNLGSRLEGVNKHYDTQILLEGNTRKQVGEVALVRMLDRVRVAGKRDAVEVWELVGMQGEPGQLLSSQDLDDWQAIRDLHDEGDFLGLQARLAAFLSLHPKDGPARCLKERADQFLATGVPANWDGVVSLGK